MKRLPDGAIPLRERRTLADEWRDFSLTIPARAPAVQRDEMRKAFYAGALSLLVLISGGLDADPDPTALDVAYLDALHRELSEFDPDV